MTESRIITIQDMQMCPLCSSFFDKETPILNHNIGMHVRIYPNGAEEAWAPMKGHADFKYHHI